MVTMSKWGRPIDVLPTFAREEQALIDVLAMLTAEQWAAPTACTGWSVHDLVAHILDVKLRRLSRDRDDHRVEQPLPGESLGRFVDRINEQWVLACRRLSFGALTSLIVDTMGQTTDFWSREDLDELGEPVTWAGPDPAPRWLDAARDYTEFWVHQQQLREAVGVVGLDWPEFRLPVVDTFMRALPYTLRNVEARTGRQIGYSVTDAGKWVARREADGWTVDHGSPTSRSPLAMVSTDADTFWRLCTRSVKRADVAEKITTEGDENVCATMLDMVTIIVPEPEPHASRGNLRSV